MEKFKDIKDAASVSAFPGHSRITLTGNKELMMCMFNMKAGTRVELHQHLSAQIGYVLDGQMEFFDESGNVHAGGTGFSYAFDPNEKHGCVAITDCTFVECFSPSRGEYDN